MGMDDLDAFVDGIASPSTSRLRATLNAAADVEPDQYAETVRQGRKLGIPASLVPPKKGDQRRLAMSSDLDTLELPQRAPATTRFLSDEENAKVAYDDRSNLSTMEQIFKPFMGAIAPMMAGAASSPEVGNKLIDLGQRVSEGLGFGRSAFFDQITRGSRADIQQAQQYWQGLTQKYGFDPQSIPSMIYQGIGGAPAGIEQWMLDPVMAPAEGYDKNGLVGAVTEGAKRYGLGKIFHAIGNTSLGTGGRAAAMGGTMGVQSLAEGQGLESSIASAITGAALSANGMGGKQEALRETLIKAGVDAEQASRLASLAPDTTAMVQDAAAAKESRLVQDFYNALGEAAGESKLQQRLPEKMRDFVAELKQDGPVDNVYVPADRWETYWQEKGKDPSLAADEVTGDRQQYLEALATGGDVVVPLEDFVSKLAGSEHYAGLADDVKLRPGAMTAREAAEFEQQYPERMAELQAMIAKGESVKTPDQKVYDDVYGQLLGIYPRDTAERYATLAAARARTRAERLGVDAFDLYNESPLKITRPLPEALRRKTVDTGIDPLLDRLRAADIPADETIFGPSLLQFLRDKGIRDEGGELKGMDLNPATRKPGQRNIMRPDGLPLDKAREAAAEAGYLPGEGTSVKHLLDAIDKELRGNAVYSNRPIDERAFGLKATLNELQTELDRRGIDLHQMDNEAVRRQLFQGERGGELWQKINSAKEVIHSVIDASKARGNKYTSENVAPVDGWLADLARDNGLEITDYQHSLDTSAVRHIQKSHGDEKAELSRGQLPVLESDIAQIPLIVAAPEKLVFGLKSRLGKDEIGYLKTMDDGTVLFFEEVRTGRRNLAALSLRKYPGTMNAESILSTLDPNARSDTRNPDLIITEPPDSVKTLFQSAGKAVEVNGARGFFRSSPGSTSREIGILENADLSTFLHETGHSWLEELKTDAGRSDAPEQLKSDWKAIQKWLGAGEEVSRDQHEQFARGIESYLMEGKAPSAELSGVFSRFKMWLTQIYRSLSRLNVNLTDDVRGVMDRLIATDEEISSAQDQVGHKPLFATAEDAGMSEKAFSSYQKDAAAAGEKARDVLAGKLMKEMQREQKAWWKDELAKVRAEVMDEVKQNPTYQALQEVLKGKDFDGNETPGLKMDRATLVERYGEEFLKRLPKGSATEYLYTSEGGLHPDILAEKYGFSSGDEMIRKMIEAPNAKRYVAAEADMRMRERHGDMLLDGGITDQALNAVHNDHWAEVLRAEITALKKKAADVKPHVDAARKEAEAQGKKDASATARWYDAERRTEADRIREERLAMAKNIPPVKYFRKAAREQIGGKTVAEISPQNYLNAERKAAREAFEAAAKGDFETAADARTKQLLNHFLYFEAAKAREEADTIQGYARNLTKNLGKIGKAGAGYLDQVQGILERFSFERITNREAAEQRETLADFLNRIADPEKGEGLDLPIPDFVRDGRVITNYRNLPMDQLRGVYDSLRMIEHAARQVNTTAAEGKRINADVAALSLVNRITRSLSRGKAEPARKSDRAKGALDQISDLTPDIGVQRPEFIFNRWDGERKTGIWHDIFWERYNDASEHQNRLRELVFPQIMEFARGKMIDRSKGPIYIKGIDASLVKDDIIAIALNAGNESNIDKLLRGGLRFKGDEAAIPLDMEKLQEILSHLTPNEIKVVNGIWKTIDLLKPEAAALAGKRTGIEPTWIESQPLEVKNGTLEGGYYPVKYDHRFSRAGEKQADASTLDQMFNRYASSTTRQGYMKERTDFAAPLSLDWQAVVSRHLDEVITDISHWEFATDAQRMLKRQDVKDAIIANAGEAYHRNLLDWVRYTVNQDSMGREASDNFERFRRAARTRVATAVLGFRVVNAIAEMGITPIMAMQHVSPVSAFKGVMAYMRNPMEATRVAVAKSDYMHRLDTEIDRQITEAINDLAGKHGLMDDIRKWAISSRVFFWKIGATMAWHGGYDQAIKNGLGGKQAVRFADSIYRLTQEGGRPGDLSAVERNPYMKELTMFIGPTLIQYNNLARAARAVKDKGLNMETAQMGIMTLLAGQVANTILFDLMRGKQPDDKDKIPAWMLARVTLGMFDGLPIARDIAGYAEGKILHEPGKDMKLSPVLQAGKDVYDALDKTVSAAQGEAEWSDALKKGTRAAGGVTGFPAVQANITGEYLYDVLTGQYQPEHWWSWGTDIFQRRKAK